MDVEEQFANTLEHLRDDAWGGIQLLYVHLAFNQLLSRDKKLLRVANRTPVFWNATRHGWQCGYMIALGRAYDHTTQHNLGSLLSLVENNLDIFSKDALGKRKAKDVPNAHTWLPDYLKRAYVPTSKDVKRLKDRANNYQALYNDKYRPLRSKVFAHRVLAQRSDVVRLYSGTRINDLQKLFLYLLKLYEALWELYHNGRKPVLKPMKFSLNRFLKEAEKWPQTGRVHEGIVADVSEVMKALYEGTAQQ